MPVSKPYTEQFSADEINRLHHAAQSFDAFARTIVFLSFENYLAVHGGLATVSRFLPEAIRKKGDRLLFLTPYHPHVGAIDRAVTEKTITPVFPPEKIRIGNHETILHLYQDTNNTFTTYFIGLDGFFTATDHPYNYKNSKDLLRDALAFSTAIPLVLARLNMKDNIMFHAQDWETMPIALTAPLAVLHNTIHSFRALATLHNSFDHPWSGPLQRSFLGREFSGETVL